MSQQMKQYVAARTFSLGQSGFTVPGGSEVLWDGGANIIVDGQQIYEPKIRGAVRMGWLVPQEGYDPNDTVAQQPISAGMTMRPAEGGNPMNPRPQQAPPVVASAQDREVMGVGQHAQDTQVWNNQPLDAKRGLQPPQPGRYQRGTPYHGGQRQEGNMVDAAQISVVDRKLKTAAKSETNLGKTSAGAAIAAAEKVKIETRPGLTREQMMSQLVPEERQMYMEDVAGLAAGHPGADPMPNQAVRPQMSQAAPQPLTHIAQPQPVQPQPVQVVGTIQTQQGQSEAEGIQGLGIQTGGGTAIQDGSALSPAGSRPDVTVVESEGIRFTNTNGPRKDVQVIDQNQAPEPPVAVPAATPADVKGNLDARRMIAKQVCPDFPDLYDFNASDRKKIARIQADFEERPDVIRAIFAAESDAMKARLTEEFPAAFSG